MKNQYPKIANIQLQISENCSDLEKEILHFHWKLNPQNNFVNKPAQTRETYHLNNNDAAKIFYNKSKMLFYLHCETCNSYEKKSINTQTAFLKLIEYFLKCDNCIYKEGLIIDAEIEEFYQQKKLQIKTEMLLSYQNKEWETISNFEKSLLHKIIQLSFKDLKKYIRRKENSNFYWRTLYNLNDLYIINLIKNDEGYIEDINVLEQLKESFVFNKEEQKSKTQFNSETNELKLKLTINNEKYHPDNPLYAGTIIFKEQIVLKPNIEYIFGQWQRSNDNLYLTIIPVSEFEKRPTQKPITKLPKQIKQGVHEFLNTIGSTFNLE
ncbi:hypothetical protein LNI88_06515 [Tenacibaculum dicentrarchi]|nr:hypothetical protein [Tenacibaculum dicentrarchi]MCD8424724.1 hypothetical protein [Tenacibaculum dicentrarchi]MCD8442250.1 hypothetical protein [Tenacibaculum dicentrarchi]